jgi:hypothetical protein
MKSMRNIHRGAKHDATTMVRAIGFQPSDGGVDDRSTTRYEPRFGAMPPASSDPYTAWLERRDLDRARDQEQVRWVFRGPLLSDRTSGPATGSAR